MYLAYMYKLQRFTTLHCCRGTRATPHYLGAPCFCILISKLNYIIYDDYGTVKDEEVRSNLPN